jgi:hypothetical protein
MFRSDTSACDWRFAARAKYGVLKFLRDPQRANQKVNQTLKERRLVALDAMPKKIQNPAANEQRRAKPPIPHRQQNNPSKNDRNSNSMQKFVPGISVLVIILRHIPLKLAHVPPRQTGKCSGGLQPGIFSSRRSKHQSRA